MSDMKLTTRTSEFGEYLRSMKRFFGMEFLTTIGFIALFLNYDINNNVIRAVIMEILKENNIGKESYKEINQKVINFIVNHPEEMTNKTLSKGHEFIGKEISMSKQLDTLIAKHSVESELNLYMISCFFPDSSSNQTELSNFKSFLTETFGIEYSKVKSIIDARLTKIKESVDDNLLSSVIDISIEYRPFISIIDGKRENYRNINNKHLKNLYWSTISKHRRKNVILIGDNSVSRTSIVQSLAYQIDHKECDKDFYNIKIFRVDFVEMVSQSSSNDELRRNIISVVSELERLQKSLDSEIIVFLEYFHLTFINEESYDFSFYYYLMPLFKSDKINVISIMNKEEAEIVLADTFFYKNTVCFHLASANKKKIIQSIQSNLYGLSVYHGVDITEEILETAYLYAGAFLYGANTLTEVLDIVDISMGMARKDGRTVIKKSDLNNYFRSEFKGYESLSDNIKKLTAYHEAGHFVVNRFSKTQKAYYTEFITIVPTSFAGGFNKLGYDPSKMTEQGYRYYLELIAGILAGRASEEIFIKQISAGAESDLESASELARSMVSNMGLDKDKKFSIINKLLGKNTETFTIKGNENLASEKSLNSVSAKVDGIMNESYQIAKSILMRHSQYVETLVNILMDEKIVSMQDIIRREYKKDGVIYLNRK